jgi:sulfite exporter TauE/SafE
MCGGMAGALGMRTGRAETGLQRLYGTSLYHVGRLGGYSLAGALCGLLGSSTRLLQHSSVLLPVLRTASGVLILLVAARVAFHWNMLGKLERLGARFWSLLRPLALRQASASNGYNRLALGFLWGWLPCGLVYSMLLLAAMSQSALLGGSILFAYGAGTLPSMLAASVFAGQLQHVLNRRAWRLGTAMLLLGFGVWTIMAANAPRGLSAAFCFG